MADVVAVVAFFVVVGERKTMASNYVFFNLFNVYILNSKTLNIIFHNKK